MIYNILVKVIYTMGKEKSIEIFNETKRIEKEGGMLIRVRIFSENC